MTLISYNHRTIDAVGAKKLSLSPTHGQVAQSVEQRIENPCVGGSIPPLATTFQSQLLSVGFVISGFPPRHAGRGPNLRVPPRPWHA